MIEAKAKSIMGGDALSPLNFSSGVPEFAEEEESQLEQGDFCEFCDVSIANVEDGDVKGEDGVICERTDDDLGQNIFSKAPDFDYETRRRSQDYRKLLNGYDEMRGRIKHLDVAKANILSYRPGAWTDYVTDMKLSDYDVPDTTTLLLVGPKGSGKSSLVNRISKALDDDKFACDLAQVSYNYSAGGGTHFLMEYMIRKGATSFCLYDTRSLSEDSSENMEMLKRWMTKGVRRGELVVRNSDSSSLRTVMKSKARHSSSRYSETRTVDFVIFVVNGFSILRSMEGDNKAKLYLDMVATTFNDPFLSFRDDKPVLVMTHGDLLSQSDRARVRLYLGELLGIPPMTQIFDIPENHDQVTELEVVGMLRYCLEHADKNLREKKIISCKASTSCASTILLVVVALVIGIIAVHFSCKCTHHARKHRVPPSAHLDWHSIRHLWLGEDYD